MGQAENRSTASKDPQVHTAEHAPGSTEAAGVGAAVEWRAAVVTTSQQCAGALSARQKEKQLLSS